MKGNEWRPLLLWFVKQQNYISLEHDTDLHKVVVIQTRAYEAKHHIFAVVSPISSNEMVCTAEGTHNMRAIKNIRSSDAFYSQGTKGRKPLAL